MNFQLNRRKTLKALALPPHPQANGPMRSTHLGNVSNHYFFLSLSPSPPKRPHVPVHADAIPRSVWMSDGRTAPDLQVIWNRVQVGAHHAHFIVLFVEVVE